MVARVTCVVAALCVVFAECSTKVRRSYTDGEYWRGSVEDASIAGDHVGHVGVADCSDDDSESIEFAYIINKREVSDDGIAKIDETRSPSANAPAAAAAIKTSDPIMQPEPIL